MARVLLPCTPLLGHLQPLLTIARALHRRGHEVDVLTAADRASQVRGQGLGLVPLPPAAVGRTAARGRVDLAPRWVHARKDVIARFVDPLGAQHRALAGALDGGGYDVVVTDTAYLGVLPLLLGGAARLPVVGISTTPIATVSVDAAPFGSGLRNADTAFARRRNRQVNWLLQHGPMRPLHDALDAVLSPYGVPRGAAHYFDLLARFDAVFQLSLPELEYPRRELPDTVTCVGPLPVDAGDWSPPTWWTDLDPAARIVHVTQGTVDNLDLGRLVLPTVRALQGSGLQVVVTTGSTASALSAEPGSDGVHMTDFVPYDVLLPRTDLLVTNGGWGGVQQAARHGVPVIVAGATEEKPEVGARVAWSGLGLDLRTGTPRPGRIRAAVDAVLSEPRYGARAQEIAAAAALRPDPVRLVVDGIELRLSSGAALGGVDPARTGDPARTKVEAWQ